MPPIAKKNPKQSAKSQDVKATKPVAVESEQLEIVYPELLVNGVVIPIEKTTITSELAKQYLLWEDEDDYAKRVGEAIGSVKFAEDVTLLVDANGKRIQCQANTTNRPFSEPWAKQLAQDILNRNWKFNLETIIISKTGFITSGQHRLIALILAVQMWEKDPQKYPRWDTEPTIQCLIACGGSDEQDVLNTMDNTRPQSPSDAFYRSAIFASKTTVERKELARMLDAAIDFLWKRTGYDKGRFQTVSESVLFEERHAKLIDAVVHLFEENKKRAISLMKLSPGQCAGMMYLMAATESDGEGYRKASPPSQEDMNLDQWKKASDFFANLAKGTFGAVKDVLARIVDKEKGGTTGKNDEKVSVLAKAFSMYLAEKKMTKDDLNLKEFYFEKNGSTALSDMAPNFGGIDVGHDPSEDDDEDETETPEQKKARIAAEKKQRAAELNATVKAAKAERNAVPEKTKAELVAEQMESLDKKFPGRFIILKHPTAGYQAYNGNAVKAAKILGMTVTNTDGFDKLTIPLKDFDKASEKLLKTKIKLAVVEKLKINVKGEEEEKCKDLFATPATKPVVRK